MCIFFATEIALLIEKQIFSGLFIQNCTYIETKMMERQ